MDLHIQPSAGWTMGDTKLDLQALAQILAAISCEGTVRAAADTLGLSYRTVWGRLEDAAAALGQPLIVKNRGRGSQLTPVGRELLELMKEFEQRLLQAVQSELPHFQHRFFRLFDARLPAFNLACNYDPVLEVCQQDGRLVGWQVDSMGARKAVNSLLEGRVDVVGFHHPEGLPWPEQWAPLQNDAVYLLEPVMVREVGLVVARGNPLDIRSIADLTRGPVRFINRQRNAGLRHWFDALLEETGIRPEQINGYGREEFTHMAVATAVAAGTADACFTLHTVVSDLDVDFVPIGRDCYYLAARAEMEGNPRLNQLVNVLALESSGHLGYMSAAGLRGDRVGAVNETGA